MMKMLMKLKKKVKEVNQMMKWMHNKVLDHQEL
jgi:ABC-type proline/glycine betaine transport system substrate-binding protein